MWARLTVPPRLRQFLAEARQGRSAALSRDELAFDVPRRRGDVVHCFYEQVRYTHGQALSLIQYHLRRRICRAKFGPLA